MRGQFNLRCALGVGLGFGDWLVAWGIGENFRRGKRHRKGQMRGMNRIERFGAILDPGKSFRVKVL